MPAPQADMLSQMVKTLFKAKVIMVPPQWDASLEDQYNVRLPELGPGVPRPTGLFASPSVSKIAIDACNAISEGFEQFIDDVSSAICGAWGNWHNSAKFVGIIINAAIGILPPGGLVGGGMMAGPMILSRFPVKSPNYNNYGKAVCMAIGQAWLAWEVGYMNPLIPFPGGAACSATMPPSPNAPVPIASGVSPGEALLQPPVLKAAMLGQLGTPGQHADPLFDAIASAFSQVFQIWKSTSMISNIMGAGGVAPPPPAPPGPVAGAVGSGGAIT